MVRFPVRSLVCFLGVSIGSVMPLEADDASVVQLRQQRDRACAELHLELAHWCMQEGLGEEARRLLAAARRYDRWDPAIGAALEKVSDDEEGSDAAGLERRKKRLSNDLAKIWSDHAIRSGRSRRAEEERWAWARVLFYQGDHRRARRALRDGADRALSFVRIAEAVEIDDSPLSAAARGGVEARRADTIVRDRLPAALALLEDRMGLTLPEGERFPIVLDDAALPSGFRMASTVSGGRDHIVVHTQYWTDQKGLSDMESVVTHELVHVVQAIRMGAQAYQRQPKWFREGIALYGAAQGPARLAWALEVSGGRIDPLLDGLEPGRTSQSNPTDYAEAWMAIRYLATSLGEARWRAFLDSLHEGGSPPENLIEQATGLSPDRFQVEAHRFARRHHRSLVEGR